MGRSPAGSLAAGIILVVLCGAPPAGLAAQASPPATTAQPAGPAPQPSTAKPTERVLSSGQALPRPVGDDYIVGPGDQISVIVHTRTPRAYDTVVTPTGQVLIEWLEPIPVAGSTLGQVRERLTKALRRLYKGGHIGVTLTQVRTFRVWLWGEVRQPGVYVVDPLMTVSDLIALSNALQESSSLRHIVLRRQGTEVPVDLEPVLLAGEAEGDKALEPGDEVYVPVRGPAVTVDGEVKRSGAYEIDPGETAEQVLARCGGVTADAALEHAYIERAQPQESHLSLDLSPGGPAGSARTALADGDRLVVPSIREFLGTVTLVGEFVALKQQPEAPPPPTRPTTTEPAPAKPAGPGVSGLAPQAAPGGPQPVPQAPSLTLSVRPGLTLLDAINQAGGVTAEAALEHATLTRATPEGTLASQPVDFVALIRRGDVAQSIELRDGDLVTVPSLRLFQGEVRISGQVRRLVALPASEPEVSAAEGWAIERIPGEEPVLRVTLRRGMRLKELISLAGGPTAEAAVQHATLDRATRGGGTRLLPVDFLALLYGGDQTQDILLEDGDEVRMPSRETFVGRVSVSGEVHGSLESPQSIFVTPLREGMRLNDLLELAGGPTPEADLQYAFLLTHDQAGKTDKRAVDLDAAWHGRDPDANILLCDGDRLYVPTIALRQDTIRVVGSFVGGDLLRAQGAAEPMPTETERGPEEEAATASGVRAPGELYRTPGGDQVGILAIGKGETVSDVIRRLGGVSPQADRRHARVERRMPDGSTQFFPIDVYKLMVEADPQADLALQNGDTLVVPQLPNMVFVLDQVQKPGAYAYRAGLMLSQLIGMAGGPSDHARPKSAVVLRMDETGKSVPVPVNLGEVLTGRTDMEVQPGDAVFVPRQRIKTVQDFASIVSSLAGMYFLFQKL